MGADMTDKVITAGWIALAIGSFALLASVLFAHGLQHSRRPHVCDGVSADECAVMMIERAPVSR